MANLEINKFQNWNAFHPPLDITQFRNAKDFLLHAVCYEERACQQKETKHLMTGPKGNSKSCYPSTLNVPLHFASGKQNLLFPLGSL